MSRRSRSLLLLVGWFSSCGGDDNATAPDVSSCEASACGPCPESDDTGRICSCVSDRCVCRCDDSLCNRVCAYSELWGLCRPDGACECICDPSGPCAADADADADAGPVACTAAGAECGPGQVCDLPPASCDDPAAPGRCVWRPESCEPDWSPVCGCDGVSYRNDCERLLAGAALRSSDYCPGTSCGGLDALPCPAGQACSNVGCGPFFATGTCVSPSPRPARMSGSRSATPTRWSGPTTACASRPERFASSSPRRPAVVAAARRSATRRTPRLARPAWYAP
jgi:hypothetical protein